MRASLIEELEVPREPSAHVGHRLVGVQVHLLVLYRTPESLDENVVPPAAFPVHADLDLATAEDVQELHAGELRALIGVEDLGTPEAGKGLLQRGDAEVARERDGETPGKDLATRPRP